MARTYCSGNLRGDKTQYPDGINYCIWYPSFVSSDNGELIEDFGICFDICGDDIDSVIELLQNMKTLEPDIYEENENG